MTSLKKIESCVVDGLESHLLQQMGKRVSVVMANQTGKIPQYPYISYTIISPIDANAKGWCQNADGGLYRQLTQVWSFTVQADTIDVADSVMQCCFEWFDALGYLYLSDNGIAVERILNIGNRDTMLTIEYEYRRGFDVRIAFLYKISAETATKTETIERASFDGVFHE